MKLDEINQNIEHQNINYNKLSQEYKEKNDKYFIDISSNILKYKNPKSRQPKPTYPIVRPDEPYKDTHFKRDKSIEKIIDNSMSKFDSTISNDNLLQAINYNTRPQDSSQLMDSKTFKSIKKDNMDISTMHRMMESYITEKVSSDQLSKIQGTYNYKYKLFSEKDQDVYKSIDQVKQIDRFNPIKYYGGKKDIVEEKVTQDIDKIIEEDEKEVTQYISEIIDGSDKDMEMEDDVEII